MSLSTDILLFSIILILIGIQSSLRVTAGGGNFVIAGVGAAVLGLLISVASTVVRTQDGQIGDEA